jgi:hypothetical protein
MLFKLSLKTFKECKSIGSSSRKASYYLIVVESPDFPRITLHYRVSKAHLPIPTNHDFTVASHR